jgi:2-keto-4-pentenoate hydratase/2-oxohepta-3-ene-1,7-dioic acid hydratase in catechol pathway
MSPLKLCRYNDDRLGVVKGSDIYDVTDVLERLPAQHWPAPPGDQLISNLSSIVAALRVRDFGSPACLVSEAHFQNPVPNAGKIVAAPVNYEKHLAEARASLLGRGKDNQRIAEAGLFLKAPSSLVGASEGVILRFPDRRSDHEIELVAVIGRECSECVAVHALNFVSAYTIGLDMTLRGKEDRSFRKSIDSYTVLGPWIVTADEIADPDSLDLEIRVNGEVRQQANTRDLLADVRNLISWASFWYTLHPGDVIMTGTPEGVSEVHDGDVLDCSIEGIGSMQVRVRASDKSPMVNGWALEGHVRDGLTL